MRRSRLIAVVTTACVCFTHNVEAFHPIVVRSARLRPITAGPPSVIGGGFSPFRDDRFGQYKRRLLELKLSTEPNDELFDVKTTATLVGSQSTLILAAVLVATILHIPNYGFGTDIAFNQAAIVEGVLRTIPLAAIAFILDFVEDSIPALQEVTLATQRSVMALLGGTFKPVTGLLISSALGFVAGFGEELLFRGVMQFELAGRVGEMASLGVTSIVFGLLHAVTPVYAIFATLAGLYFGWLFQIAGNLAVPITTHSLYDVGALLYAHWTISRLSKEEQQAIIDWAPTNPDGHGRVD